MENSLGLAWWNISLLRLKLGPVLSHKKELHQIAGKRKEITHLRRG